MSKLVHRIFIEENLKIIFEDYFENFFIADDYTSLRLMYFYLNKVEKIDFLKQNLRITIKRVGSSNTII